MQFVFEFLADAMDYSCKVHDAMVGYQVWFQLCDLCQHVKVVNAVDTHQQNNHDMHQEMHVAVVKEKGVVLTQSRWHKPRMLVRSRQPIYFKNIFKLSFFLISPLEVGGPRHPLTLVIPTMLLVDSFEGITHGYTPEWWGKCGKQRGKGTSIT